MTTMIPSPGAALARNLSPLVRLAAAAAVSLLLAQAVLAGGLYEPRPMPDRVALTWTGDPATTQAVTWRTSIEVTEGLLELAPATGSPDFRDTALRHTAVSSPLSVDGVDAMYHTVELSELTPAALYAYRVGDGSTWSEWFHFRTASADPEPFSFIYFGDAQNEIRSMWSRVIRQAYSDLPEARFMLHAGDLVNHAASDTEWGEWFAAGGWVNASLPSIATPGNHEYDRGALAPQWRPQFAFPDNGPADPDLAETVYFIDFQGVRIISINPVEMILPQDAQLQAEWLEEVLASNPHRWTIVTHHYPVHAAAEGRIGHPWLAIYFKDLYESYGVDLVLQGHDHTYARGTANLLGKGPNRLGGDKGPVYVVSVAGPKQYEPRDPWWAEKSGGNLQLYQLITVEGERLRFEAYTATGERFDAFTLVKSDDGTSRLEQAAAPGH